MRHLKKGRKLGRDASHRRALFANLATSLFKHEIIETTDAKAKDLRGVAEKLITLAKRGDLHARRQAYTTIRDQDVLKKLFDVIGPRFKERNGGYTRVLKTRVRVGDCAPMSVIELMDRQA